MSANTCPFCKEDNRCNVQGNCWCMNKKVPASMLDLLPNDRVNRHCICERCVTLYQQDKSAFVTSLVINKPS